MSRSCRRRSSDLIVQRVDGNPVLRRRDGQDAHRRRRRRRRRRDLASRSGPPRAGACPTDVDRGAADPPRRASERRTHRASNVRRCSAARSGTPRVAALSGGDATAPPTVDVALTREFVLRRVPSTFVGCMELIFKHAAARDVVYDTVLLRDSLHGLHALRPPGSNRSPPSVCPSTRRRSPTTSNGPDCTKPPPSTCGGLARLPRRLDHHAAAAPRGAPGVRALAGQWRRSAAARRTSCWERRCGSWASWTAAATLLEDGIDHLPAGSACGGRALLRGQCRGGRSERPRCRGCAARRRPPEQCAPDDPQHARRDRGRHGVVAPRRESAGGVRRRRGSVRSSSRGATRGAAPTREAALGMAAATTDDLIATCTHAELELGLRHGERRPVRRGRGARPPRRRPPPPGRCRGDRALRRRARLRRACTGPARAARPGPALVNVKANISQLHLRLGDHTAAHDGSTAVLSISDDPAGSVVLTCRSRPTDGSPSATRSSGVQLLGRLRSHAPADGAHG